MIIVSLIIVVLLVLADQVLKRLAVAFLAGGISIPFIPKILDFYLVYNDGAAFSMLAGKQGFLIAFTAAALILVFIYWLRARGKNKLEDFALLLILSGGIGNLIDRVMNHRVVDYIRTLFMDFPIFNFADICVCCGVGLLAISMILDEVRNKKHE